MLRTNRIGMLLVVALGCVPRSATAADWSVGIGMGAAQIGTAGYFGIGPQAGVTFGGPSGPVLVLRDMLLLLPTGSSIGVDNQLTIGVGYSTGGLEITAGGMLAVYRIPMCGIRLCGPVIGIGPGGFAQVSVFLKPPLGITARGTLAWYGGESLVPSGNLAWSATVGPIVRW